MRQDILEAGIRVLRDEGPLRFTTQRVANAAGISVGSLYQYFPNKEAIVYALRWQLVERGWAEAQKILDDLNLSPRAKIQCIARMYFLAAARDNAEMGKALHSVEVYFPQEAYVDLNKQVSQRLTRFLREAMRDRQDVPVESRFGADLLLTSLEALGRSVARRNLSQHAMDKWAQAFADMACDYLRLA